MSSKTSIVIKSNLTSIEFKFELIRKIRNIIPVYAISFVEHPNFTKLEIVQPASLFDKKLTALEIEYVSTSI